MFVLIMGAYEAAPVGIRPWTCCSAAGLAFRCKIFITSERSMIRQECIRLLLSL